MGDTPAMLEVIDSRVPQLTNLPQGCSFAPRCTARLAASEPRCLIDVPPLFQVG